MSVTSVLSALCWLLAAWWSLRHTHMAHRDLTHGPHHEWGPVSISHGPLPWRFFRWRNEGMAGQASGAATGDEEAATAQVAPASKASEPAQAAPSTPVPHPSPDIADVRLGYAFSALAAFFGVWMLVYPYRGNFTSALIYAGVASTGTYLALWRHTAARRFDAWWSRRWLSRWVSTVQALLVLVALCGVAALERPWNTAFPRVAPQALLIEFAIVLLAVEAVWSLTRGHAAGVFVVLIGCATLGIVEAFILDFRGTVISFGDIFAFGTAMAVRTGYAYQLDAHMLASVALGFAGTVPCMLMAAWRRDHASELPAWRWLALRGVALVAALVAGVLLPDYQRQLGIRIDYRMEQQLACHRSYLILPSLIAEGQDLPIERPAGYSHANADAAESDLAALYDESGAWSAEAGEQFEELQSSVVVVMNETFCDLGDYYDLPGYAGPQFFSEGLTDVLARGGLAVSVHGGGTCNTEFELLCGQSMAFVGSNKYPYTLYNLSDVPSLARQFAELGYATTAIHPNLGSNWNRIDTYASLGFDEFYDIEAFAGYEEDERWLFHNDVSDAATYDMVLDILREGDGPQFIFDVTMQNHGGYDQGGVPERLLERYASCGEGLDENMQAQLAEYLACIDESDRALRSFVRELRTLDRPVVLVFFGDHQPSISTTLNDLVIDESAVAHDERLYQSNYLVWANYDVSGRPATADDPAGAKRDVSASDLAATALSLVGAPLTPAQKAQLGAQHLVEQLNLYGYLSSTGTWRHLSGLSSDPSTSANAVRELRLISYRDFGSRV